MNYVITDMDHTLSDAAWRDPLLGKWDVYYDHCHEDKPVEFVARLLRTMIDLGSRVAVVTARPERVRKKTLQWLIHHDIRADAILMRGDQDHRPSRVVKAELVEKNFVDLSMIDFVIEDRDDACAAYREMGLNVLQVRA